MNLWKINLFLKTYALLKLPLLAFVNPKILELQGPRSVVRINLGYRTKNHLNVMYFGALAIGAELSIAIKAVQSIQASGHKIDFIFKDFKAEFLKRSDSHVHFVCEEADLVDQLILDAKKSSDRMEKTFSGYAFVPSRGADPVMKFQLTLSVKNRSHSKN